MDSLGLLVYPQSSGCCTSRDLLSKRSTTAPVPPVMYKGRRIQSTPCSCVRSHASWGNRWGASSPPLMRAAPRPPDLAVPECLSLNMCGTNTPGKYTTHPSLPQILNPGLMYGEVFLSWTWPPCHRTAAFPLFPITTSGHPTGGLPMARRHSTSTQGPRHLPRLPHVP